MKRGFLFPNDKDDAVGAFDEMYRAYCEKYRMQLKGIFPNPNNY